VDAFAAGVRDRKRKPLAEKAPVGKTGQRIVVEFRLQALRELPALTERPQQRRIGEAVDANGKRAKQGRRALHDLQLAACLVALGGSRGEPSANVLRQRCVVDVARRRVDCRRQPG